MLATSVHKRASSVHEQASSMHMIADLGAFFGPPSVCKAQPFRDER